MFTYSPPPPPPLYSTRTVNNNTQGISVQGGQTSSPPPLSFYTCKAVYTSFLLQLLKEEDLLERFLYCVCCVSAAFYLKRYSSFSLLILFRIVYSYIAFFIVNPNCTGIFSYRVKWFRIVYTDINCLD